VKQLAKVFKDYPHIHFYRVGSLDDPVPDEWVDIATMKFIGYPDMIEMLKLQNIKGGYMQRPALNVQQKEVPI
jgi:hypothetical protein